MKIKILLISPILLASLSACSDGESYYHKQQVAYSRAKDGSGLVVNPPLSDKKINNEYLIPTTEKAPASVEAPPPPGSTVDPNRQAIPKDPTDKTLAEQEED